MDELDRNVVCVDHKSAPFNRMSTKAPEGWHDSLRSNSLKEGAVSNAETTLSLKQIRLDLARVKTLKQRECLHCHCIGVPQGDTLEETHHQCCATD